MSRSRFLTISEQVADCLREEIDQGKWKDVLPGLHQLAGDLEVDFKTITVALDLLEKEGVIISQGTRRPQLSRAQDQTGHAG